VPDIPEIRSAVTGRRMRRHRCGCGRTTAAPALRARPSSSRPGPSGC